MKVALTGGATGIGAATVALFRQQGAHVTVFDLTEPAEADAFIPIDMADPDAIARAAEAAPGPFDALINNAGLPPRPGTEAQVLNVNFIGMRAFAEAMLPKLPRGSAIVSTASRAGARWQANIEQVKALMALTSPGQLPDFVRAQGIDPIRSYDLSKEAVIAWTAGNTERLIGLGLRANCVSPAAIDTGILQDFVTAFGDRATRAMARTGGAGGSEDVARAIVFLADPASAWIKGANLVTDGGAAALADSDTLGLSL